MARAHTPRTSRRFIAAALVAAALVVVLLVVLLGACSDDKKKVQPDASVRSTQAAAPGKPQTLQLGSVSIQTWGADVKLPKATKKKMLNLAQTYFNTAVHDPLTSGKVGKDYDSLFEKGVRVAATGRDEKAMTDVVLGQASDYNENASKVNITGLADDRGALLYLATNFSMRLQATTAKGPIRIARDVEFTYEPSGKNWLVTAYRVKTVRRTPKAKKTTTSVAASGGTTTP